MAWWGVSIGPIVIVVTTVVATVIAAVVAAVVAAVLVIAAPLRVVTPLTPTAIAAVVTGLGLVVAAVILALAAMVVAHLLAFCHSNTEPERLPSQHRTLALLNRLLLLALLPKLDEAVTFLT